MRANSYKIWFLGSVVWLLDAAVSIYFHGNLHAIIAAIIALLFFGAGVFFQKNGPGRP